MINLIVLDIDGVITDGSVTVDSQGNELKRINLKDIDAIFELHRKGFRLAAITGEDTDIVNYFEKRFPWDYFYRGNKTKKEAMKLIEQGTGYSSQNICYVGDGKYDVEPLAYAGLGLCPANAIDKARQAADIILQNNGGEGCLWEILEILDCYNNSERPQNFFIKRLNEHEDIFKRMASDEKVVSTVIEVAETTVELLRDNHKIFFCGNGGSAADAQHIATEFIGRFYKERTALNAEALSVNSSTITAIGNDYSFEKIFARQLEAKASQGDAVVGISTSGKSKNVLEALKYGHQNGIKTVMLMGDHEVPELNDYCDYIIKVPSKITPRIQEAHIFIGHTIAEYVEYKMFGV